MTADPGAPAIVCTLTTKELATRSLEWGDLAPLALTAERIDDGVVSTYPIDLADPIEDLAAREATCCGTWLRIATSHSGDTFTLTLTTANPDGLAVISAMVPASTD